MLQPFCAFQLPAPSGKRCPVVVSAKGMSDPARSTMGLVVTGILWFAWVMAGHAASTGYPVPDNPYVNDRATIIDSVPVLYEQLSAVREKTGIHVTVLTINSIKDYSTGDRTIESFATHLFNTWGIGDRETNKGVLVLVAKRDRKCRIELAAGYGTQFDHAMKRIIDDQMAPCFKRGDYSEGIYRGAHSVVKTLTGMDIPEAIGDRPYGTSPVNDRPTLANLVEDYGDLILDVGIPFMCMMAAIGFAVYKSRRAGKYKPGSRPYSSDSRQGQPYGQDHEWLPPARPPADLVAPGPVTASRYGESSGGGGFDGGGGSSSGGGASGSW